MFRSQFPPPPTVSSIPEWQLVKKTKPQVEQHGKNIGTDILNTSHSSIINELSFVPLVGSFENSITDGGMKDKNSILISLTSKEPAFIFGQSTCNDVVAEDKLNSSENN